MIDLLRLIVLEDSQAAYVFGHHWDLIDVCAIGYVEAMDLKDKEARTVHNYHLVCLKLLTNAYQTKAGRAQMQDQAKSMQLVQFCTKSFLSSNIKTVSHAAMCLFNHLLCLDKNKNLLREDLEQALKAISEVLSIEELADQETLLALLLCECRILY